MTLPSAEFLGCLMLDFMCFLESRPTVSFSDMWKKHEEFRLLNQQSFGSASQLCFISDYFSVVSVVSSAPKLFMNECVSAL